MPNVPPAIRKCFKMYDTDRDGLITKEELSSVLSELDPDAWTEETLDQFWESSCLKADKDGDGALSIQEFLAWVYRDGDGQKDQVIEEAESDEDDESPFQVLKIARDDFIKALEFENKKKAKKKFLKFRKHNKTAVMVKNGTIRPGKCCGDVQKVTFLIGIAYGRGWSDMGPLNAEGSKYCIFEEGDDEEDDGGEEEEDDEEAEEFHVIFATRDGEGIKRRSFPKRKRAVKVFKRKRNKGMVSILVNPAGHIVNFFGDGDEGGDADEDRIKILTFIIGTALGKGLIEDMGPLAGDGPLAIFDDDVDVDGVEDDDE